MGVFWAHSKSKNVKNLNLRVGRISFASMLSVIRLRPFAMNSSGELSRE